MNLKLVVVNALLILFAVGCSPTGSLPNPSIPSALDTSSPAASQSGEPKLIEAYPNLSFSQPLDYRHAGDESNRIFVVEKSGRILVFPNDAQVRSFGTFLDLSDRVDSSSSEKGLLSLAFHPDYRNNGYLYVNYTNRTSTVIARYQVDPTNPDQGQISSELILLSFPQPYANHNGGQLMFGSDGFLYIGTGDGGAAGDPQNNAQNPRNLLGKILRIDIDHVSSENLYSIPADNPFYGNRQGFREEIYAYGLRNPWKFSFDQKRGWLWAADVGQSKVEEIDIITKGANYGWNKMEGSLFYPSTAKYDKSGLTLPVWEYQHPTGKSVTGGFAYYGQLAPSLNGLYIYGDFVTGLVWALQLDANMEANNRTLFTTNYNISSFGLDQNNELYLVDYQGKIYKFTE